MADSGSGIEGKIKELKVSGHMMSLDPGLYCVFNAPDGPVADRAGLPGVRITPAPGSQAGSIQVSSFAPDGWIGTDSAALVRVTEARADLLVTVYQSQDTKAEAPKLQVVLLAPPPKAAPPSLPPQRVEPKPAAPAPSGPVEVVGHIYGHGDKAGRLGEWMGEPGSQRWIEGFGLAPLEGVAATDIEYQAVLGRGWLSPWSEGGQFCGSRGMSLPILGLRVRLRGEAAKTHKVVLSGTFVDGTKIGPVGDGEPCEAPSLAALEAFNVSLEPLATKNKAARAPAAARTAEPAAPAAVAAKPDRRKASKPVEEPAQPPVAAKASRRAKAAPVPVEPPKPAPRPAKRTPATTRRR